LSLKRSELVDAYSSFYFDFDGTLADTNNLKREAIYDAALEHINTRAEAEEFAEAFIRQSGISREIKIAERFDGVLARRILDSYNAHLEVRTETVTLEPDALQFVEHMHQRGYEMRIISGGDPGEICRILESNKCRGLFKDVLGPPVDKVTHLIELSKTAPGPALFFGDAPYDAEASAAAGVDFCYVEKLSCVARSEIRFWRFAIETFEEIT
jgi:phosphoglycolate phosphatase-like HAD superfamily hydrolase